MIQPTMYQGRPHKYPWLTTAIGESFFVPDKSTTHMMKLAKRFRPLRFKSKKISLRGVTGTKVSRIE
jgi:hypothetical protein